MGKFQVSLFGCVPKADVDPKISARVIHDLSYPRGQSTNDISDPAQLPNVHYHHIAILARRLEELVTTSSLVPIYILKGDVKGAFRHASVVTS